MAPRPGLEPGTYGLTESQARRKPLINQRLMRVFDKRVIFRVITPKVT